MKTRTPLPFGGCGCSLGRESCNCTAPTPTVIRTRRTLLERLGAAVEAPVVALVAWWHLQGLQSRRASLVCAHLATCDELSALKAIKFARPYDKAPTLDARIKATTKDCTKFAQEIEAVELEIEARHQSAVLRRTRPY